MHTKRVHSFSFQNMPKAKVSDILGIINKIAPPALAENWDNVGLQVGDPAREVQRIMVALDPGSQAVDAALDSSCQLLLTHHPLIFKPLKRISTNDETGKIIHRAISGGLSIISAHTNYDSAGSGVNDLLAATLGVTGCRPLKIVLREELLKLVVYIPETHLGQLMEALLPFSGMSAKYADCSFRTSGQGTFRPLAGAAPFIGTVGGLENVEESRFEILVRKSELQAAIKALRKAHPYEEPAFDIIPLLNEGECEGLGRVGTIETPALLKDFAVTVKERLGLTALRVVGDTKQLISRVALCGGSGSSLLRDAAREGADLLVTGDIKYHDAREAQALGIALLDAGHFATERLMIQGLSIQLEREVEKRKLEVEVLRCSAELDPFEII
ncbi:MAG TPA: Nif3-like dinuclear metal center hexameric protein [Geobacteraceae bacterium]|nr:Nif3-like dinuclear metal center hexameric protein [Geobacteraceae bacterium]